MIQSLREIQTITGAVFDNLSGVPLSYGNDTEAIAAVSESVALCDRSHWGLLQITGEDRQRFLHNQSTNEIQSLQPGLGCDTVFVTSTARTLDLATAYITSDSILVIVSPSRRQTLMQWLDRYIFPMDQVQLQDITDDHAIFSLIGPQTPQLLEKLGLSGLNDQPDRTHHLFDLTGIPVRVAVGSGLATQGYTLIAAASEAANLWKTLVASGAIAMGDRIWEDLRIQQGRPVPDLELTDDYNPLEAGLWQTISFEKGCYIGQETIARLNTYKGVKQQLWGIRLNAPVKAGEVITVEDQKVGKLTSYTDTKQGPFGLGYVRTKAGGVGLKVRVGEVEGEVVDVPFLRTRQLEIL